MIALVLGLLVVSAAVAVFLSNKDSYRTNLALGQVQENSRIAFELLARDIRQAGITSCGNANRVANALSNGTTATATPAWYADFGNIIRGYDSGTTDPAVEEHSTISGRRAVVPATGLPASSSVALLGAAMVSGSIASYSATSYGFTLTGGNPGVVAGDIVVICDPDHAVLAQVTSINSGTGELIVNSGTGVTASPGNCSRGLGFPTLCTTAGNSYSFAVNSMLSPLSAVDWFIGNNPLGGRSLYRRTLVNVSGTPMPTSQEMVRNVTDMQLSYHVAGASSFVTAAAVTTAGAWGTVDAVQIVLNLQGSERFAGTNGQPIRRQLSTTVNLRNRS
ncbi:MAG: hypothetical protein NTV69_15550 [Caldilinea sp.]|nr:hypothetical protein [Caldilinea sp.]